MPRDTLFWTVLEGGWAEQKKKGTYNHPIFGPLFFALSSTAFFERTLTSHEVFFHSSTFRPFPKVSGTPCCARAKASWQRWVVSPQVGGGFTPNWIISPKGSKSKNALKTPREPPVAGDASHPLYQLLY